MFFKVLCVLHLADLRAQLKNWHLEVIAPRLRAPAGLRRRPRLGAGTAGDTIGLRRLRRRAATLIWLPTTNEITASPLPPVKNARTTRLPNRCAPSSSWSIDSAILFSVRRRQRRCRHRQGAPQMCLRHGLHHQQGARAVASRARRPFSRPARSQPSPRASSHRHARTLVHPNQHPQERPVPPPSGAQPVTHLPFKSARNSYDVLEVTETKCHIDWNPHLPQKRIKLANH